MEIEIKLPEWIDDQRVWLSGLRVQLGQQVNKDQDLVCLFFEDDKACLVINSPSYGIVKEIYVKEGEDVTSGQMVMKIVNEHHYLSETQ